jgi:hypothetical protein
MKKLVVVLAVLVSLVVVGVVAAQAVTYSSGFQVQNLENGTANIVVTFYKQDGTIAASSPYTISANSSRTFFPITDVAAGFNGSVVVSSDRNVRAANNLVGSGPANYFSTANGFQSGSTSVSLPLIMCNNSGFDTWFNVQNAGAADANITINYVPGSNGTAQSETAVIKPGAAKTFDQKTGSTTKNCSTLADGSTKFIGSAAITSDQPIVAEVEQLNTGSFKVLMGYGGFNAASPTVALPLIMANNSSFYTGIQVQNTGSAATTVTVTYSANTAAASNPVSEVFSLAAGASKTILQNGPSPANGSANNWATFGKYIGSATISNSANQPLVAIANQVRATPALGSAYEGFDPTTATTQASAPLIMSNNSTYYTGIQVQNVDTANVNVTITYGPNTAGAFAPAAETFSLTPGNSKTIIQSATFPANGSTVNNWGTNKYIGSATITANGNVVAIVNQVSLSLSGDQFATGDAFNY